MTKTQKINEVVSDEPKADSIRDTKIDYTRRSSSASVFNPLTGKRK